MTSSTSLTISGSSAEVGSSNSITFGFMASARAIADALLLAAGELRRVLVAPGSAIPTRSSSSMRPLLGLVLVHLAHLERAEGDVLQDRLVGEEVEALEHHADVGPQLRPAPCPRRAAGSPSTLMVPLSIGSSRLIVRHSVDLPEPDGPMHHHHLAGVRPRG